MRAVPDTLIWRDIEIGLELTAALKELGTFSRDEEWALPLGTKDQVRGVSLIGPT